MILSAGQTAAGTDHDKLIAQLEIELKESQEVVRLQQQLLQVSATFLLKLSVSHERSEIDLLWLLLIGQPGLHGPIRTLGFLLFGGVGTSSDVLGRADSSEEDF